MFEFQVNLIVVSNKLSSEAQKSLKENCTHVVNDVWIMEGDLGCLLDDGVNFNFIEEGIVGALGGLSQKKLLKICDESFGENVRFLKYNPKEKYKG